MTTNLNDYHSHSSSRWNSERCLGLDEGLMKYEFYTSMLTNEIMAYMIKTDSRSEQKRISVVHIYCNCNEDFNNQSPPTESIPVIKLY